MKPLMFAFCLCAASPSVAQILVPRDKVTPAQLKGFPKVRPSLAKATVDLFDVPATYVTEHDSAAERTAPKATWAVTRTAPITGPQGAIGTQIRSALYRRRTGIFTPQRGEPTCGTLVTTIDLSTIRRNGFYLSATRVDPVVPAGSTLTEPARLRFTVHIGNQTATGSSQVGVNVPMASADTVQLDGPIAERRVPTLSPMPRSVCHSEYYLHLTLTGPRGIDPYTGKPYPPRSPVN